MAGNPYGANQSAVNWGGNPYGTAGMSITTPQAQARAANVPTATAPAAPVDKGVAGGWLSSLAGAANANDIANPIRKMADGTWSVPETFMAGNRWSNANVNKDWATQFGGKYTAGTTSAPQAITNPFNPNYGSGTGMSAGTTSPGTWSFSQDPTQYLSSGQGATFVPGQGQNNSWKSAFKEIAPIAGIAAAPFLAAGMAGAMGGAGGSFMGGIGQMSGMGGLGAGAAAGGLAIAAEGALPAL